jgi:hypothetical protein
VISDIREHAATYISGENRAAQDSHQIYHCLMNTLTPEGFARIMDKTEDYMVNGIPYGPCLLKVVISTSIIECTHFRFLAGTV